jgi:predicted kinase
MSNLIVLTGLPASGKSTLAEQLKEFYNAIVLSSDEIRKELLNDINDQSKNTDVFEEMNKRTREYIQQGKNVIYDATNINPKRRIHLIKNEIKADKNIAYFLNTPMYRCTYNDSNRDRKVGYEVIDKMYRNLHIPTIGEGWDEVHFVNENFKMEEEYRSLMEKCLLNETHDHESLFEELNRINPDFTDIYNLPQDSTYHSFSVSRHTYYVYKYIMDNYHGARKLEMLYAAVFHDLGKEHCKSFYNYKGEEKRHANFLNHENVSAQKACDWLTELGYEAESVKYVVDLIQFHMTPMNMSEKQEKKLRGLLTNEQYDDLMFLHEADLQAK